MINDKYMVIIKKIINNQFNKIKYNDCWEGLLNEKIIDVNQDDCIVLNPEYIEKNEKELIKRGLTRYELLSLINHSLYPIYFKNELLTQYLYNPNYNFQWNHYRGTIYSSSQSSDDIALNHISLAYDLKNNNTIIMIFLTDLVKLDKDYQNYIRRFELLNRENLVVNKYVVDNLIHGKRSKVEHMEIFDIILQGIDLINKVFLRKYNQKLFISSKNDVKYEHFRPIFIPTKLNYYLFILELYKIIYQDINLKTIKKIIKTDPKFSNENLNDNQKWPKSKLLREAIGDENRKYLDSLIKLRNVPAHEIFENVFDYKYWEEQDNMLINTYQFVNSIIIDYIGEDDLDIKPYLKIFGKNGSLSFGNGFNKSPYRYYDGQIQLISEEFDQRDAEYVIAFKDLKDAEMQLSSYIIRLRPDLNPNTIIFLTDEILKRLSKQANSHHIASFFKGKCYLSCFEKNQNIENYIEEGTILANDFINRYPLKNIFIIADSTDPYFVSFDESVTTPNLVGQGFITELFHYFKKDFKYNNVTTDHLKDLPLQILSNIWD